MGKKQALSLPGRGVSHTEETGSTRVAPSVPIRWQQGRWDEAEQSPKRHRRGGGASGRTSAGTERDGSNRRVSSIEETGSELCCNRTTWMLCQEQTERGKGGDREILQENHPGCPGPG